MIKTKVFDLQKFSTNMRMHQAEFRLKATKAAEEIGISKATLSRINNEKGLPDVETFYLCCQWMRHGMSQYFIDCK